MRYPLSLMAILLAGTAPVVAQDAAIIELDEIVFSGGLTPFVADAFGRTVSVITSDDIEERGLRSVQDALRAVPGVSVSSVGANYTQVRLRGGESNNVVILVDGVELGGGGEEYILSGLETANIDRIEVLRGPQSVFYGSNASSGVINIITRSPQQGVEYGGAVEAGNGYSASGYVSQRTERMGLGLTFSRFDDEGFDASGDGGEKDGTRRTTLGLTGDWKATDDLTFGFNIRRSDEDYDYDVNSFTATTADEYVVDERDALSEREEITARVYAEYEMLDGRLSHNLSYSLSRFDQSSEDAVQGTYDLDGETRSLKYRASLSLDGQRVADARQLLNLLVEDVREETSTTFVPTTRRESTSIALEYRAFLDGGLDIQAGVRHDMNDTFKDFTTWNIGLSWRIPDTGLRLHASAGTGVVNPNFFENFGGSFGYISNTALKPEQNRGFDIGIEAAFLEGRGLIDVTYFNEELTDAISDTAGVAGPGGTCTPSAGAATTCYVNLAGKSPREGVEVSASLQATEDLSLRLAYTYLDAKTPSGAPATRRPEHELGLGATLKTFGGKGSVTADLRHVSGSFDTQFFGGFTTERLPDFTTVNLSASYDLTENLALTGRVVNLFDEDYSESWGYASRGRTIYVGIQGKW
jgi:vitamin B12 transporter